MRKNFLKNFNFYLKKYGIFRTSIYILSKIGIVFYFRKFNFLEKVLCDDTNGFNNGNSAITKEIKNESDLMSIKDYFDGWYNKKRALKYLKDGHRLYVTSINTIVINYIWIDDQAVDLPYFEGNFILPRHSACLRYTYTIPSQRNKGFMKLSKKTILAELKKEGYQRMLTFVEPKNLISLKVNEKLGFVLYQTCIFIRIIFLKLCVCFNVRNKKKKVFFYSGKKGKEIFNCYSNLL